MSRPALITSVTAWKRALKPGDTVRVTNDESPANNGIRPVLRVQTNAFSTQFTRSDGEVVESWCYYARACDMSVSPDGRTLTKASPGFPTISYTVLEGAAAEALRPE